MQFYDWFFSEKHAFEDKQFMDNELIEISDENFVYRATGCFNENCDQLAEIEGAMLLVGLSKISSVSSMQTGLTIGEIVSSGAISQKIIDDFFASHERLFSFIWLPRKKESFVVESFRVYWDNMILYGGAQMADFFKGSNKRGRILNELVNKFKLHDPYGDIIKGLM